MDGFLAALDAIAGRRGVETTIQTISMDTGRTSHSPLEFTAPEDLDRGVRVRVLAATLPRLAGNA